MLDDDVTLELHGLEVLGVDMFIEQKLHKKLSEPFRFLAVEYKSTAVPWPVSLPMNDVRAEGEGVVLFDPLTALLPCGPRGEQLRRVTANQRLTRCHEILQSPLLYFRPCFVFSSSQPKPNLRALQR